MAHALQREWHRTWSLRAAAPIHAVALSSDGSLLAAACGDGRLYVYDRGGALLWKHRAGSSVEGAAVSADGSLVAAYSSDGVLAAFDSAGAPLWSRLVAGRRHARMSLSADGARICTQDGSNGASVLDRRGAVVWSNREGGHARSLGLSADGSLAVGILDGPALAAFDAGGRRLWERALGGPDARAAVSRDGSLVAALSGDFSSVPTGGALSLWSPSGERIAEVLAPAPVACFSLSADGGLVVAGALDRHLYAFGRAGAPMWKFAARDWVLFSEVASGGTLVVAATGPDDETIYALDAAGRLQLRHDAGGVIRAVAVSETGTRVAVAAGDRSLFVLDAWER